ncbi:hypothetical protein MYAM1_003889 [Malassezia yamatoensis]|uniref:Major facilitator superfamily (MFS) profile domain-containing protein n=1 Tax=Malassezia yamatoensis TaxID=253288 RepID=A0AAJ6CI84_9BASI|nr:hypothetical protein MYAM1_003889 [Malassezia yamatoensis]
MFQFPQVPGAEHIRGTSLTVLIAFVCGCGFLLFGYDQGVMSALIEEPMLASTMPQIASYAPDGPVLNEYRGLKLDPSKFDPNIQGAIVGCYELGALLGSIFVLFYGDKLGRRSCIVFGSSTMIIGTIIMVAHDTLAPFTVGRVIAGIGNGLDTASIPMLQSELSKPKNRGFLVFIEGALLAGGVMVSYWIDFGFYFFRLNSVQWRFPIAFQAAFALVLLLGIFFIPESPRWLVKKGRSDEARRVMSRLRNLPEDNFEITSEVKALEDAIFRLENEKGPFKFRELATMGPEQNLYRVIIACVAQMFQQLTGINNLTYYANTVFQMVNSDDVPTRLLVCGSGVLYFVAAAAAMFVIDVAGRRNLMIWCAAGMALCFAIMSGMIYKVMQGNDLGLPKEQFVTYGKVAEAFIYLYFVPWSIGWLGMTWLYPPEVTPIRIRAPAAALSTCSNWIWNFTVVMISPPAFKNLRNHTFTMFGAFNVMFIPFVYMFFPETKQRGLEEMDLFFADQHREGFWNKQRFMTTACYKSISAPHLNPEELDAILNERDDVGSDAKADAEAGEVKQTQAEP